MRISEWSSDVCSSDLLMSLAIDEQLLLALNPLNWLRRAARLGAPYFAVAATTTLTLGLGSLASEMLTATLPAPWGSLIAAASFYWALFASAHLLGYLIYQYHQRLGFTPGRAQEQAAELPRSEERRVGNACVRTCRSRWSPYH